MNGQTRETGKSSVSSATHFQIISERRDRETDDAVSFLDEKPFVKKKGTSEPVPRKNSSRTSNATPSREGDEKSKSANADADLPKLDDSARAPNDIWNDYFSKRKPDPDVIRKLILNLHQDEKYEHVIAAIEAAILNDQSQPWMYEVLALSMKIVERPQAEIERVFLSQVDFTAADVPSMIYSAAYLTRLGADAQALKMYRQSSRLDPSRPEPYILGLSLARKMKDWEAVVWGAVGILETGWAQPDASRLMKDAEVAIEEARRAFISSNNRDQMQTLERQIAEARRRDLIVLLNWSGEGDVDLIVEEPKGTVCSFQDQVTSGGGVLVHDGYGPEQQNCYEEYVCMRAWPGTYRLRVRHVSGDVIGKRAKLTVIRHQGTEEVSTKTFSVAVSSEDQVFRVELPEGRRMSPLETNPHRETARGENGREQSAILPVSHEQIVANEHARREARRRFRQSRLQQLPLNAVGYQPIISTLSEGAFMGAMAVVSGDRRYVRISVSPQFSSVTDIFTFSFLNSGNPNGGGNGGGIRAGE